MSKISNRLVLLTIVICASAIFTNAMVLARASAEPIKIMVSSNLIADMTQQVGGERVAVESLITAGGDPHEYQANPRDAIRIKNAQLMIINGLGLERSIEKMARTSLSSDRILVLGLQKGINPLRNDPHIWQDPNRVKIMVETIAASLTKIDAAGADYYRQRLTSYQQQLSELDRELRQKFAEIPKNRRKIITSHDAFGYFGATYDIEFLAPEGTASHSEASASRMVKLIEQIKREQIKTDFCRDHF